ncbi:type II toxin-antitoxin system RelE/ParE family toxin [Sphingomonas sp. LT1P40]|uniref:type II toxin-antitoxin system RelE/ParE family toxin n=1 Tax=Alteristakelama amylovorans TaxID=3096166 RepID=UPI002FCADFE9
MFTLRLRAGAVADLRSILEYGSVNYGEEVAIAYVEAIDKTMERLREYPEIGETRPDFGKGLRSLPCREHRIYYRLAEQHISVVRVLHKAMDAKRWLD